MLLEFKTKNYKSFKEELIFSLLPAPKQKGLDYSILNKKIGKKNYKALCSSVIYGANAAGKTNIIGAMDTFKNIVLRGHIRNDETKTPNIASYNLELIPNMKSLSNAPVKFYVKFVENNFLIEYGFDISIGRFLEQDYKRKILKEYLKVNDKDIFVREKGLIINELSSIKKYLVNDFEKNQEGLIEIAKNNLNSEELFLTNGFKIMFSAKFIQLIIRWFREKFVIVYHANLAAVDLPYEDSKKGFFYVNEYTNDAAKLFGVNSNKLGYYMDSDSKKAKMCSSIEDINGTTAVIDSAIFESYGTLRFVNIFPLIVETLKNGGTLIVDEFDASIHPIALINLINIFHNDEININKAQLIFNTHNPIFLNSNLFRRDEIKFVERDEITHLSTSYSLSDFGTSGTAGVRTTDDYMKNYFINRYGAIRDIDFSPVLKNLLTHNEEE